MKIIKIVVIIVVILIVGIYCFGSTPVSTSEWNCETEAFQDQVKNLNPSNLFGGEIEILDLPYVREDSNTLHESGQREIVCTAQFATSRGYYQGQYYTEVINDGVGVGIRYLSPMLN